ncbi:MAG: alkaline phosphatase family protein [Phycisphaerales bacterium]|nr:alkaline phosphatase family protein [Phycisphaerales bacterium]
MAGPTENPTAIRRPARRVLLVGWDAADWRIIDPLLEAGRMPHLASFLDTGIRGNIASLQPMLSPILWTSIATGKHGDAHQILGFAEPDGDSGRVRPVTSTSRRCQALWNILSRRGLRSVVLNWFASHPAEHINGVIVSDRFARPTGAFNEPWKPVPGSIWPQSWEEDLNSLRLHPSRITREQVSHFVPEVDTVNPTRDPKGRKLVSMLARCASIHAAATALIVEEEWDFFGIYLEEIDRFGHEFMEYRPPRMPHVDEQDFARYRHVIDGIYTFHDMMLGRLIELAGDDTTIIIASDHGFHSDDLRPEGSASTEQRPVAWHRPYGMLAIRGPHVRQGENVYGASLLDLAPTILAMLGQPVPRDMPGSPLLQVFDVSVDVESTDTLEDGGSPHDAPESEDDPWVVREMMVQLADLGYVEDDKMGSVVKDRRRNLAQIYHATGRTLLALREFEAMLEEDPDDRGARMAAGNCLLTLGRLDECEAMLAPLLEGEEAAPFAAHYRGMIAFRRGDDEGALAYLRQAEAASGPNAALLTQIGQVYLRREHWDDAERAYMRALELDPDHAAALNGLGVVYRSRGRLEAAVLAHMRSVALLHHQADAHQNLGIALMELGRLPWAIRAFRTSLKINPGNAAAHRCLALIFEKGIERPLLAERHRRRAEAIVAARRAGRVEVAEEDAAVDDTDFETAGDGGVS